MSRIVLTGAGGSLARDVTPALLVAGHEVVAVDVAPPPARPGLIPVRADVTDLDAMREALSGADALVHLAGIPLEADPADLWTANIHGTQVALEAARLTGTRRVVLASSIHAVGYVPVPERGPVPDDVPVRPNTFYGVSKAAVEALGSLYADRWGLEVVLLRIASRQERPTARRHLQTWLSPGDAGRLVIRSIEAEISGCITVWGVSANARRYVAGTGAARIGFTPLDDAEESRAAVEAGAQEEDASFPWLHLLGGEFCSPHPPRTTSSTPYLEAM